MTFLPFKLQQKELAWWGWGSWGSTLGAGVLSLERAQKTQVLQTWGRGNQGAKVRG
jgi:hypothetical protein